VRDDINTREHVVPETEQESCHDMHEEVGARCATCRRTSVRRFRGPEKMIEIYHIAPGKQVQFLKLIALYDQANLEAGLPARELYVHSDGASWDFC
jgi:hypothetical protein